MIIVTLAARLFMIKSPVMTPNGVPEIR